MAKPDASIDEGRLRLETFVSDMQEQFAGAATVYFGKDDPGIDRLPSGSLMFDWATHGGMPKGRMSQLFGPASSGKTSLAINAAKRTLDDGGAVFWGAAEDFDWSYAARIGVDPQTRAFAFVRAEQGNVLLDVVVEATRSGLFDMIVVDSIAVLRNYQYLLDKDEAFQKGVGKRKMGGEAAMIGEFTARVFGGFSRLGYIDWRRRQLREQIAGVRAMKETKARKEQIDKLAAAEQDMVGKPPPAVVLINQVRAKDTSFTGGGGLDEPGGNALKHNKALDVHFRHMGALYEGQAEKGDAAEGGGDGGASSDGKVRGDLLARRTNMFVAKCKVGVPHREGSLLLGQADRAGYRVGVFDDADAALQLGLRYGVIEKAGSWYTFADDVRAQGSVRFKDMLRAVPDAVRLIMADVAARVPA